MNRKNRKKRCINCGDMFYPQKHILRQRYCSKKSCQAVRTKEWIKHKLKHDRNYKAYKKAIQNKWKANNPDYWIRYREVAGKTESPENAPQKVKSKKPTLKILIARSTLAILPKMGAISCNCKLILGQ